MVLILAESDHENECDGASLIEDVHFLTIFLGMLH